MSYSTIDIAKILNADLKDSTTREIQHLSVDSRKIFYPSSTLFFALATAQRDGHTYIPQLYKQGVRAFVVNATHSQLNEYSEASFLQVPDTLKALQTLAAAHRSLFKIPVIGITGSNGKTIVKEWLNQLLATNFNIVRSPKSYNSQIGVPLSVWQMSETNTLGIFEAGISKPGEMASLQQIIQPTIGVLTNIGAAHDEGFENRLQKLNEKLLLFKNVDTLIYCSDDQIIKAAIKKLPVKTFTWGMDADCDIKIISIEKKHTETIVKVRTNTRPELSLLLPFVDDASIENALHCFAVGSVLGVKQEVLQTNLKQLHPVEMRLEWKKAINNSFLINDSYSNDLSSLIIALDYLQQQQQTGKQTVILSDIFQSGISNKLLYEQVAELLQQRNVARVIGVGSAISQYQVAFQNKGIETRTFPLTDAFIAQLDTIVFKDEAILLKGARVFGFEKIVRLLEQQVHQTVLEINLTALGQNLKHFR